MADTISFARGAPSLDIVDVEGLREAAQLAFDNDPAGTTAYGTSVGYVPLREWIAEQHGVGVDQVLVTNGSMQADAFLFQLLVNAGDSVIVESPTYDRTLLNLRNRGADIHMVALETDGIDVDELERLLREEGVNPTLAHVIPNFQNPAGYTLSAPKRAKLLELAREFDFTLFEDDPYIAIRFEGEGLPTMLSQDDSGQVVYASSFSKTVCPGIRVGYLVGPQAVIKQIQSIATNTYISPNMVAAVDRQPVRAARAAWTARSRRSRTRCASGATRWSPRSGATCPRRSSARPRAATSCGSCCPRRSPSRSSRRPPPSAA